MLDSLYIAATGMHAQQSHLDIISHNLANTNTTAFKKSKVDFSDLLYRADNQSIASESNVAGAGAAVARISKDFQSGDLKQTNDPLNIAIRGRGFIEVELKNGEVAYTRNGALKIDQEGYLETIDGYKLNAQIQIPPDSKNLLIDNAGLVTAEVDGETDPIVVGQLELANFYNEAGLSPVGNNLYLQTEESGVPTVIRPGEFGGGEIAQGYLEASNVDMASELLELVITQRAYEVNSKVIMASDEILKINNNLRS